MVYILDVSLDRNSFLIEGDDHNNFLVAQCSLSYQVFSSLSPVEMDEITCFFLTRLEMNILLYFLSLTGTLASVITPRASLPTNLVSSPILQARQTRITFSTCGFVNGNANQAVIAPPGSICRVDTGNSIWGVCTTSVIDLSPSECGWVGRCVDNRFCSTGCGLSRVADYITTHWYVASQD